MSNGDEAMSPAEFAKLMGAYPEPSHNPLPAYGGYMDNSPANFAWVQNNDYFGAEDRDILPLIISIDTSFSTMDDFPQHRNQSYRKMAIDAINELKPPAVMILEHKHNVQTVYSGDAQGAIQFINDENNLQPSGGTAPMGRIVEAIGTLQGHKMILTDGEWLSVESAIRRAEGEKKNCGCGQDPCITYGADSEDYVDYTMWLYRKSIPNNDDYGSYFHWEWENEEDEEQVVKEWKELLHFAIQDYGDDLIRADLRKHYDYDDQGVSHNQDMLIEYEHGEDDIDELWWSSSAEDEYESMYSQLENKLMKMIDDGYQPSDIDLEEVVSEVHDPNSDSGSSGIFQMLMNDGAEMLRENETFEAFQGNPEFEEKNYYGAEKKN